MPQCDKRASDKPHFGCLPHLRPSGLGRQWPWSVCPGLFADLAEEPRFLKFTTGKKAVEQKPPPDSKDNEVSCFAPFWRKWGREKDGFTVAMSRSGWEKPGMCPFAIFLRESISHAGGNLIFLNIPFVERVTIHDISLLEFARRFWPFNPSLLRLLARKSCQSARKPVSPRPCEANPGVRDLFSERINAKRAMGVLRHPNRPQDHAGKALPKTLLNVQNHVDGKIFKP